MKTSDLILGAATHFIVAGFFHSIHMTLVRYKLTILSELTELMARVMRPALHHTAAHLHCSLDCLMHIWSTFVNQLENLYNSI